MIVLNFPNQWENGYIAEEMDSIGFRNLVTYDQDGLSINFNYKKMVLHLTEVIKMHECKNQELEARLSQVETKIKK